MSPVGVRVEIEILSAVFCCCYMYAFVQFSPLGKETFFSTFDCIVAEEAKAERRMRNNLQRLLLCRFVLEPLYLLNSRRSKTS